MGVEIEDASLVAGLIGTKVFADELISFTDLNVLVCNRQIKVYYIHVTAITDVLDFTSMYVRNSQGVRLGRLKIRDVKLRHNQKCGVGKCETKSTGVESVEKRLGKAKRTCSGAVSQYLLKW